MKEQPLDSCYNCGSTKQLTDDHIPPKGFFPPEYRQDLITLRCCDRCNTSFKLDDEAFRIFAASHIQRSKAGDWIWTNKVMDSSFKRSPKLKQRVREHLLQYSVHPPVAALSFPKERGNRFLIRITKGLMRKFYPEVDYSEAIFEVSQIEPTQEFVDTVLSRMISDERGNGTFRFWRVCEGGQPLECVWIYVFYDGLMFTVDLTA